MLETERKRDKKFVENNEQFADTRGRKPANCLVLKIHYSSRTTAVHIISFWVDWNNHNHSEDLLGIDGLFDAVQYGLCDAIVHSCVAHTADEELGSVE
jgi:hypothetical protein